MRERVTWQEDETQGYTNPYNLTPPFVLPWAENIQAADSGGSSVEPTECVELAALKPPTDCCRGGLGA